MFMWLHIVHMGGLVCTLLSTWANIGMGDGIKIGLYGILFIWVVVYTSMGTNVQWWADLVVKKRNVAYSHELATFRLVIIRK